MITGISHVAYAVSDMKKSVAFYCDLLGFEDAFDITDENNNPNVKYIKVANGQFLELLYNEKPTGLQNGGYSHLCLAVDNAAALAKELEEKGIVLAKPLVTSEKTGNCIFWANDPDGNRIEFMQVHPDSPQNNA